MAILVEEEKRPVNWIGIITAIFIVVAVFVLAYFLFFKKPEIIDQVTPTGLSSINEISKIKFDPEAVVNSPTFNSLKDSTPKLTPRETPGKQNPFKL
jgi:uncharacterized membrane protein